MTIRPPQDGATGQPDGHDARAELPRRVALALAVRTLLDNGHTTHGTVAAVTRLARRWGMDLSVVPSWNHTVIVDRERVAPYADVPTSPTGTNMHVVVASLSTLAQLDDRPGAALDAPALIASLEADARKPPYADLTFAIACGTGACALAIIFGAHDMLELVAIAIAACLGGFLRRFAGRHGVQLAGQAILASLLAGLVSSAALGLFPDVMTMRVALCPAMVLVPGPHLLNGLIDVTRHHVSLGWSRLIYAATVLGGICVGLLLGLLPAGGLPVSAASTSDGSVVVDVIAAAIAAASYSVYFGLRPQHIVWPVLAGALAHAVHYLAANAWGLDNALAAVCACIVAGLLLTPVAHPRHLSFGGIGFAAVVSLVPGMFVFRAVSGLVELMSTPSPQLVAATMSDASVALLTLVGMGIGLMLANRLVTPRGTG